MAAFNQIQIDTVNGLVLHTAGLSTEDETASFQNVQKFTPDEADSFARALTAGATAARAVEKEEGKGEGKGAKKKMPAHRAKKKKKPAAKKKAK